MFLKKFLCLSFVIFLTLTALGQKSGNAINEDTEKLNRSTLQSKLFLQAESLNDSLSKESFKLSVKERSLLYANSAKIWRQEDFPRSKMLFEKAIKESTPSINDSLNERKEKIKSLQELLPLSVQFNDQATKTIFDLLKSESKKQPDQNLEISKAFSQAALTIIKSDPKTGFDLAVTSLKLTGKPSENTAISQIIFSLSLADKKLAEDFFLQVLNYSQVTKDSQSIGDIVLFASPVSTTNSIDFLSVESKKLVLSAFLEDLLGYAMLSQQNQLSSEQKQVACDLFLRGRGMQEIIRTYLPEKAVYVSQISQQAEFCQQTFSSQTTQSIMDELSKDKKELSVDELIESGFNTKDTGKRVLYFSEAISKLSKTKEYERIINLLDSMDDGLRRSLGTTNDLSYWKSLRNAYAFDSVLQKIKDKDYDSARQVIEKTPLDLRPLLEISVSQETLKGLKKADYSNPEQSFAFDLMADARRNLLKIDDPFSSVDLYLSLLNLYAILEQNEVPSIFQETIKGINKADDYKNEEKYRERDFFNGRDIINLTNLSAENLTDISYQTTNIQNPYSRVRIKLGMLESILKKYMEIKEENKKLQKKSNTT